MEEKKEYFIIYDRYAHDEWFNIDHICKSEISASGMKERFLNYLTNFILYGPDDSHTYGLYVVSLTDAEYRLLSKSSPKLDRGCGSPEYDLMVRIFDEDSSVFVAGIYSTDGQTELDEFIDEFAAKYSVDPDSARETIFDAFDKDDIVMKARLKAFLKRSIRHVF